MNPNTELHYWRDSTGKEVDFIVKEELKVKQLIQVCWDVGDLGTKKREKYKICGNQCNLWLKG